MKCPTCAAWVVVKETRTRQDNTRRRTYECGNLHRFNTVERVETTPHGGARTPSKLAVPDKGSTT
jgi:transcriptional regulator NrdR family protein